MVVIELLWIALLCLLGSFSASTTVVNGSLRWMWRRGIRIQAGVIYITSLLLHALLALVLVICMSLDTAVLVMSGSALAWGLVLYFREQRFANPLNRPMMIHEWPWLLPLLSFGAFLSSITAILLYSHWYWAFIPVVMCVAMGYLMAEMAIRREMKEAARHSESASSDRRFAIFVVNNYQGRGSLLTGNRYPFP